MSEENALRREVEQFILDEIDSVPHLEALLLLWKSRPSFWSVQELAHDLYISTEHTASLLRDLQSRGLVTFNTAQQCAFNNNWSQMDLMRALDRFWRRELIRISSLIHCKASPSVRQFAGAFRFRKAPNLSETDPKKDQES